MPYIYTFDHNHRSRPETRKRLLGGKGASLHEMTAELDLPVPPGFTITTKACLEYLDSGWPDGLDAELDRHVARLEKRMDRRLGDPEDPLLVSVRSGAARSMPGMMDTVLNLGLHDESVEGLAARTGDERFAYDSYRRFIAMFGEIVLGLPREAFVRLLETAREWDDAEDDGAISAATLRRLCGRFKEIVERLGGEPFPQDPHQQLRMAVAAVFDSWNNERAIAYRDAEGIAHDLGTAVSVQTMVFGNRGERSGTGVGFTRNASTGEQGVFGDFLVNAQGEDVVAGIRNTLDLAEMAGPFPEAYEELLGIFERLEVHYRDMMDVEFTIEDEVLWILQARVGKRTGRAALRMAVDMTKDRAIKLSREEALNRITADHVDQVLHPQFAASDHDVLATGLGASPGAAVGRAYFAADRAAAAAERGEQVILVRQETSPEDVQGMAAADGVLTSRGGLVSHAAVVARGWGKPAVCGAEAIEVHADHFVVGGERVDEGDVISIDGSTGEVVRGALELTSAELPPELATVCSWADRIRKGVLGVRANADTAEDATQALEFGAEGIGLCRTEHQFLGERLPAIRRMILAATDDEEAAALDELAALQEEDFSALFAAMDGRPVTIRLLDPPLHEFLPDLEELVAAEAAGGLSDADAAMLEAARRWAEQNPMLGTRGVRLAVLKDGLYRMQARAVARAAVAHVAGGGKAVAEIMIPLVVDRRELDLARSWVDDEVEAVRAEADLDAKARRRLRITVGTMIETPRAALLAGDLAGVADFFSFGTNDLTQLTYGFSRDDVERRLLPAYLDRGLLDASPFEHLDAGGVGALVAGAVAAARAANDGIKLGVCGEHAGDPASIRILHDAGVDYVSASPYRVPVARIAAAQAVIAARN